MLALLVLALSACGCTRFRFVVDAIPAEDELTETTVLTDGGSEKVALIEIRGLIADARRSELFSDGENPVDRFAESLARAEADGAVKALIVRINSPGGTVTASDLMYRELCQFRERSKKPVVVLMSDVAASGGFYVACAGDHVIAHPTTITGSVGVIIQTINFSEGMRRIGIRADAITSGPNKALASPFEPMSPEHREILQGIVNEFYDDFLGVVRARRPAIERAELERVTDGRIVTGRQALDAGLVDALGDLRDAWAEAKTRAGLERSKLVKYHRPLEHVGSPYAQASAGTELNLLQITLPQSPAMGDVGFWYLWDPGVW